LVKKDNNRNVQGIMPLLFVGVLMGALDISIVGPAIPSIEKSFHIDEQFLSWIFSIFVLFNLVGISLFARLSDIYGRRIIYVISILIFATGSIVVAMSNNYTVLLVGRSIQGFGASGIFPVASAVIGDLYPVEKRGRLLGLLGAVFGLILGSVSDSKSFNYIFLTTVIALFVSLALAFNLRMKKHVGQD